MSNDVAKRESLIGDVTGAISTVVVGVSQVAGASAAAGVALANIAKNSAEYAEALNLAWVADGYSRLSDEERDFIKLMDPERKLPEKTEKKD